MKKAILILSHQLLSMVDPLKHRLMQGGYGYFILSSASARSAAPAWHADPEDIKITEGLHLTRQDIDAVVADTAQTHEFIGCISVWDGYRGLMAYANQRFGAQDIREETVALLRDKLAMRNRLCRAGLSRVSAQVLDEDIYQSITEPEKYFIKPRIGLASMGTFPASQLTSYAQLAPLRQHAASDKQYAGVFPPDNDFIIEGLINGTECSFEVSLHQGRLEVLAVHEKLEVSQAAFSVLEGACVCPPRALSTVQLAAGTRLLEQVMATLGVETGVYHVELKCDAQDHWEVIEINPRIGGAYIVESTRLHSGVCLLQRWLALITGAPLAAKRPEQRSTFFRVFFGQPGKTLSRLECTPTGPAAVKDTLLFKPHDTLPQVEREIFLGMALWDITDMPPADQPAFFSRTQGYITTEYLA